MQQKQKQMQEQYQQQQQQELPQKQSHLQQQSHNTSLSPCDLSKHQLDASDVEQILGSKDWLF